MWDKFEPYGNMSLVNNLGAGKQASKHGLLRSAWMVGWVWVRWRPAEMEICSEIYVKESILGGMRRGERRG